MTTQIVSIPTRYTSPLTTDGDLFTMLAGVDARIGLGGAGEVLYSDGVDPYWTLLGASGTYTGDGTDARQIPCGFAPSMVIIYDRTGAKMVHIWSDTTLKRSLEHSQGANKHDLDVGPYFHATDGFVVNAADYNVNARVCYWLALL